MDSGANIRDGITSVVKQGVCSEIIWPYDVDQFAVQPSTNAYTAALQDVVTDYLSLESIFDIKNCLAEGFPVVFGTQIYESFESMDVANSGIVPMPAANEQLLGGHCMVIVGYDDSKQWFIVRNSWGTGWGAAGYCFIPYAFIQQYASDFWTIRKDTGELETETLKCQGVARSGHWPTVRAAHLKQFPSCAVCGSLKDCEVHHIAPFHLHKNLELSPDNLITLCAEYDRNHHYLFGHFLNWKSFNSNVKFDAAEWNKKILNRPQ